MIAERVFVSGAAGVIGRELVPRLLGRGAAVWAADLKPRPADFGDDVQYRQGDLNFLKADEVTAFAPTLFIHLAATFERSAETYGFWTENFTHNVQLSHHLMTLLKDTASLRRVVFASSYLIYDPALYLFDTPPERPTHLRESDPIRPRNLTGVAKLAHETELRFLAAHCGDRFTSVSARIFRGYGRGSRDVVSRWVRGALAGEQLSVFRPEGSFDYVYAGDTAEGLVRLAQSNAVGVINLGTGQATRVGEVLSAVATHFPDVRVETLSSDIPFEASCADVSLLRQTLGWVPGTTVAEGVRAIVDHETRHQGLPERRLGHVLVTSASRKAPLIRSVIHAARQISPDVRVLAGDLDPTAPARHVADGFVQLPPTDNGGIDAMIAACQNNGVTVVIPTRDGELAFWATHADRLKPCGIEPIVSDLSAIEICRDKKRFSDHVASLGLRAVPCIHTPTSDGRYVVKERCGSGSRGIGLNLTAGQAAAHAAALRDPIVQPFIAGKEVTVDAWLNRSHVVKGLILRYRDRVENGESVATTTFRDPRLESDCKRLLESLPLRGPVVIQLIIAADGTPWFLELNPRFGGASTAGVAAGLDVWTWSLGEAFGTSQQDRPFHRVAGEILQVRLPADLHCDGPRL